MIYFPEKRFAYIHIPKTSGTSFARLLQVSVSKGILGKGMRLGKVHEPIMKVIEKHEMREHAPREARLFNIGEPIRKILEDAYVVVTLRNPYAAIISLYFYAKQYIKERGKAEIPGLEVVTKLTPQEFIVWYCENFPSYFDFLNIDGELPKLKVIWLENYKEDIEKVMNKELKLGINMSDLPHLHFTGTGKTYKNYFDESLYKMVEQKQAEFFKKHHEQNRRDYVL